LVGRLRENQHQAARILDALYDFVRVFVPRANVARRNPAFQPAFFQARANFLSFLTIRGGIADERRVRHFFRIHFGLYFNEFRNWKGEITSACANNQL
jgi:hypothetical protein